MTPRQRAYKLAEERGVTLHPARDGGVLEGVELVGPRSAKMVDRKVSPRHWQWDGAVRFCGPAPEPPNDLWRRVCAVLEEMKPCPTSTT